jgi:hypothetical protein
MANRSVGDVDERESIGRFSVIYTLYRAELLLVHMESLPQMVFREPDGRRKGLIMLFLSFICLLIWVYTAVVLNASDFFIFFTIALGFSGVAESLPPDRRRSAGTLRMLAVGTFVVFLGVLASAPELLLA